MVCPCLSHLPCYCASDTSHHLSKCKDNGNCKSLLSIHFAVNSWKGWKLCMKSKAKEVIKWIFKHTNITSVCRKSAGREVLSFSSLCRLCGVTSTGCASLRESELFSHSSVCYPNLMSYLPEPSSFLLSFLQLHWLPKDSLNIFVRERERLGLVGSKWLKAVIPTSFTLCENGSQAMKSKAKLGFSPWDKWSNARADQCTWTQFYSITHTPILSI